MLRYSALSGNTLFERAVVLYSGIGGPASQFAQSSVAAVFPSVTCATAGGACFLGDYRYGAFIQKSGTTLSYFTPWTGQSSTMGVSGPRARGAVLDVTP